MYRPTATVQAKSRPPPRPTSRTQSCARWRTRTPRTETSSSPAPSRHRQARGRRKASPGPPWTTGQDSVLDPILKARWASMKRGGEIAMEIVEITINRPSFASRNIVEFPLCQRGAPVRRLGGSCRETIVDGEGRRVWLARSLHPADPFIDYSEWSPTSRVRTGRRAVVPLTCSTSPRVHARGPPPGAGPRSTSGLGP
jgi:hypothetical protein